MTIQRLKSGKWKERLITGFAALMLVVVTIFGGRHYFTNAAGLNGLTGTGKSSNALTVNNFPEVTSLDNMGGANIVKRRSSNNTPLRNGNTIRLSTPIDYTSAEIVQSSAGNKYARVSATATIPMDINMKQSWVLKCKIRLPSLGGQGSMGHGGIFLDNGSGTPVGFAMYGVNDAGGERSNYFGWSTVNVSAGLAGNVFGKNGTNLKLTTADDMGTYKDVVIQYNSSDGSMTCSFAGKTATLPSASSRFRTNKSNNKILFYAMHSYTGNKKKGTDSNYGSFEFQSFKYTDYTREITNTQLTDYAGRPVKGPVGSGHVITVQHNMKGAQGNKFFHPGMSTANCVDYPLTGQQIKVNGSNVSTNSNSLASGLVFSPVSVNSVSYKLQVQSNKEYVPGDTFQFTGRMTDDFLVSAASQPSNWPRPSQANFDVTIKNDLNRKLINKADVPDGSKFDYYFDSTKNKYGWYKTDAIIRMPAGGDFNELNVDNAPCAGNAYSVTGNTNTTGRTINIFGRKGTSTQTEALSAVSAETIKVDKTKPTISVNSRATRTIKANDANSGIQRIEWRKVGSDWETLKDYTDDANGRTHGSAEVTDAQYTFDGLGTYEFRALDFADNYSSSLTVTNRAPSVTASDHETTWYKTTSGFSLLNVLNVRISDPEETLSLNNVKWSIKKADDSEYPEDFEERTGSGTAALSSGLPMGKYTVTLTGKDSDGNEATKSVNLRVKSDGAPAAVRKKDNEVLPIVGTVVYKPDGTAHTVVRDEYLRKVDIENPYSGGKIDKDEAVNEVENLFSFITSYNGGTFSPSIKITKSGIDFTSMGISTVTEGDYIIHYQAADNSGNSVTLELTYKIREDYYVDFDPGKGEFHDPDADYTIKVKIGDNIDPEDVPEDNTLKAPVERTFIGWSTDKKAEVSSVKNPQDIVVNGDTTLYAVYAEDRNRDNVDDREQALYDFVTSDEENTAFPQGSKTLIGITPPDGEKASLTADQIPKILKMPGFYLKGWKVDGSSTVISTEKLCELEKEAGTFTKITAVFDERIVTEETEAAVTFFSSDPENAPLQGGEAQKISLETEDSSTAVQIGSKVPKADMAPGYVMLGWKTDQTGDRLLSQQELAELNIYGGNNVTCIAYFRYDPTLLDQPVTFRFFSNDEHHAPLSTGNGHKVELLSVRGAKVSLNKSDVPKVKKGTGCTFKGWRTNVTGDRILSTEELCKLQASANDSITCIAYTDYKMTIDDIINDPEIIEKIITDERVIEKIINNKEIIEKIISNEKVIEQIINNKEVIEKIIKDPQVIETIINDPLIFERIVKEINNRTELGEKIIEVVEKLLGQREKEVPVSEPLNLERAVMFTFFSTNTERGTIKEGEGSIVLINTEKGGKAALSYSQVPAIAAKEDNTLIGWQTNLTRDRILTTKELCQVQASAGTAVACRAVFDMSDVQVVAKSTGTGVKNTGSTGILSHLEDEKVPLGAAPAHNRFGSEGSIFDQIRNCIVHFVMLGWVLLVLAAALKRLSQRKHNDYPVPTDKKDYITLAAELAVGILLFLIGGCILEIVLLVTGIVIMGVYIIRMKRLDRKDEERVEAIREELRENIF